MMFFSFLHFFWLFRFYEILKDEKKIPNTFNFYRSDEWHFTKEVECLDILKSYKFNANFFSIYY